MSSTPKKKSARTSSSSGGGSGGGGSNPIGNYRLPSTKEYRAALKAGYKKVGGDQPSAKDLTRMARWAGSPAAFCVGDDAYRWSGSGFAASSSCWVVNRPAAAGPGVVVQQISPEQAARSVIATLNFTAAAPGIGPDHDDNHLSDDKTGAAFDAPVGYPLWLYADGGTIQPRTVNASAGGMSVRISIKVDSISWAMGDGHSKSCGIGTKWSKGVEPATPSPTCGYVYEKTGRYTVTATTHWMITWSAGGQTGTIPFAIGRDRPYRVGELQTIIR